MSKKELPLETVYEQKLQDPRWIRLRYLIIRRDDYACQDCGGHMDWGYKLHVHHKTYAGENPWDTPLDQLITLCQRCHENTHNLPHEDNYLKKTSVKARIKRGLTKIYGGRS